MQTFMIYYPIRLKLEHKMGILDLSMNLCDAMDIQTLLYNRDLNVLNDLKFLTDGCLMD